MAPWPPISQYPAFLRALDYECLSLHPPQLRLPLRSRSLTPLYGAWGLHWREWLRCFAPKWWLHLRLASKPGHHRCKNFFRRTPWRQPPRRALTFSSVRKLAQLDLARSQTDGRSSGIPRLASKGCSPQTTRSVGYDTLVRNETYGTSLLHHTLLSRLCVGSRQVLRVERLWDPVQWAVHD